MKSSLLRLMKGSVIYGVSGILQRFMSLLMTPFFTRALAPEDYGVLGLIMLVGIAMSGLLTLGTGNSMGLLYFKESDHFKRSTIIWTNVLLMAINGIFWFMIIYLLAPVLSWLMFKSDNYVILIRLIFLSATLTAIADPWLAYLRYEEKVKKFVILSLFSSALSIVISTYFVLFLKFGTLGVIMGGALVQLVMLVLTGFVVGRLLPFNIDWHLIMPLIRIGFPSIFGLFAFLLIDYADRQIIERMLGLPELGIYSVGYSFGMAMSIVMGAFSIAWPPFFMSYVHKPEEAREIFSNVLTYYVLGFGCLIVVFFFAAKPVIFLMAAPDFYKSWTVVGLVAAAYAVKGCYLIILPGIYFANKLGYQSVIEWTAAIINIGLNLWLIPYYGILGSALATFLGYISLPVLTWIVARNYLNVDYHWRRLSSIVCVVAFASTSLYQLWDLESLGFSVQFISSSIVIVVFSVIVYNFLLDSTERDIFWRRIKL